MHITISGTVAVTAISILTVQHVVTSMWHMWIPADVCSVDTKLVGWLAGWMDGWMDEWMNG
jgi:hypothetical protein